MGHSLAANGDRENRICNVICRSDLTRTDTIDPQPMAGGQTSAAKACQQWFMTPMTDDRTRTKRWPDGCLHPKSCARHHACMYVGCVHANTDIASPTSVPMQPSDPRIRAEDRRAGMKKR